VVDTTKIQFNVSLKMDFLLVADAPENFRPIRRNVIKLTV